MRHPIVDSSAIMARVAKTKQEGVHRLEDIVVEEVSLVDRAANQRKFLVVKRSDHMGTEATPNGKGGLTTKKKTMKAASLEVPPGFKEMVSPLLAKASEMLGELVDQLAGSTAAEIDEEGGLPGVPAEFSASLTRITGMLEKCANLFPVAAPETEEDDSEVVAEEAPSELQMRAAADNLAKVYGNPKVTKAAIAKVGAKMSKDRLSRLDTAIVALTALRGELSAGEMDAAAKRAKEAKDEAASKSKTAKAESDSLSAIDSKLAQVATAVEGLAKGMTGLAGVVRRQGEQIGAVQKARSPGNGASVESAPLQIAKNAEGAEVSWPLDMNSPVTRDNVEKSESFFDND